MNYYKELQLTPDADIEALKKAVMTLQRKWQRRANAPTLEKRQEAERQLSWITEALDVFSSTEAKAAYDKTLFGLEDGSGDNTLHSPINELEAMIDHQYFLAAQKSLDGQEALFASETYAFLQMDLYRLQLTCYLKAPWRIQEYSDQKPSKALQELKSDMLVFYKGHQVELADYDDGWIQPLVTDVAKSCRVHIGGSGKKQVFVALAVMYLLVGIQDLFWGILGHGSVAVGPLVMVVWIIRILRNRQSDFDRAVKERSV